MAKRKFGVFVLLAIVLTLAAGCPVQTVKTNLDIRVFLYREAGFNLAYYTMRSEADLMIERTRGAIGTAEKMLDTTDAGEMARLVIDYIEQMPQFKSAIEENYQFVGTASRLLAVLVEIEMPSREQEIIHALRAFLGGADDALAAIEKARASVKGTGI